MLGKHAHAWPEVYLTGVGWVPFEPTPSRGLPGAEAYTGVPAAQEGEAPQAPASTIAPATTLPGSATTVPFDDTGLLPPIDPGFSGLPGDLDQDSTNWPLRILAVILVLAVLGGLWLLIAPASPGPAGTGGAAPPRPAPSRCSSAGGRPPTCWPGVARRRKRARRPWSSPAA